MVKRRIVRTAARLAVPAVCLALVGCGDGRVKDRLVSPADSVGYSVGLDIGEALDGALSVPLDFAAFVQGVRDTIEDDTLLLDADDRAALLKRFSRRMYGAGDEADSPARAAAPPATVPRIHSLHTDTQRMSYAVGVATGGNLKRMGGKVDIEALAQGMIDTLYSLPVLLERKHTIEVQRRFVETARERVKAERRRRAAENAKRAARFLEANARKDGVRTTASGLQYRVLREGAGTRPDSADRVEVLYTGSLVDSTVFDSSYASGEPRTVVVGGMMRGWVEGLQLMREGAVYRFFVPPKLGYGEQGRRDVVPANAVVVFDIELIDVVR